MKSQGCWVLKERERSYVADDKKRVMNTAFAPRFSEKGRLEFTRGVAERMLWVHPILLTPKLKRGS